jgi:hypothetical protein
LTTFPVAVRGSSSTNSTSRGHLEAREVLANVRAHAVGVEVGVGLEHDEGSQALPVLVIVDADDRDVGDLGMIGQEVLDLAREDVLPAGDDHLVVTPGDEQPALLVDVADIAGREQAVKGQSYRHRSCSRP